MTCEEIHAYFESDPIGATHSFADSTEISEHIGLCSECNRFVGERNEIAKCLRLVRDSVPATPLSLDQSVLANYRNQTADQRTAESIPARWHLGLRDWLGWAAAMAFAILVAYVAGSVFIPSEQGPGTYRNSTGPQAQVVQPQANTNQKTFGTQKPLRRIPATIAATAPGKRAAVANAQEEILFPTKFQSLMYCDQISCPEAMDVIRVQLPASVWGPESASSRSAGAVSAEVLVGADGIARGIRLVE